MARGLGVLRFECTRCGQCCRRFRVPLTSADLRRLLVETRRPVAEWVQWLAPDAVEMTGEPETFVCLPQGRRLLVLAWEADGCRFLSENLCSIHPARPRTCRAYPFDATWGKRGGIRRLRLLDTTGCEHTWGTAASQREVSHQARLQRTELEQYALQVIEFNRRQRQRQRLRRPLLEADDFFRGLQLGAALSAADAACATTAGAEVRAGATTGELVELPQ
jgi:Fe-S-cluster containining protein